MLHELEHCEVQFCTPNISTKQQYQDERNRKHFSLHNRSLVQRRKRKNHSIFDVEADFLFYLCDTTTKIESRYDGVHDSRTFGGIHDFVCFSVCVCALS